MNAGADGEILSALQALARRARNALESPTPIDSWMRSDGASYVHEAITALGRDPAIAAAISLPDSTLHLCVLGGVGFGYALHAAISEYLSATLSQDVIVDDESMRLLRFLRVTDGVVEARARVTIVGFAVETPIELAFGHVLPAAARDLALRDVPAVMPPAVVFEYAANVPARIAPRRHAHPFTEAEREQLEGAVNELHDTRVGRLLVAHALMYTGPVQEHYVRWIPRYSSGDVGHYLAPPAAVWTEEWPQPAIPFPIDDLCKAARLTGVLREPLRVAIAARRYQQARTERTRPADKIVDYVVAIEAITQSPHGKTQGARLSEIIGGDDQERDRTKSDFKLVKETRNQILHDGKTPHRADGIASVARSLVDRGILGVVREEYAHYRPE